MNIKRNLLSAALASALALQASGEQRIAAIDARMGEVYLARFQQDGDDLRALGEEVVVAPADAMHPGAGPWHGIGTGFGAQDGALRDRFADVLASVEPAGLPRAGDVARLAALAFSRGEAVAPERAEPAYLRNNVALTLVEQQAMRGR